MRFKSGFTLREISGENVLVPTGAERISFNRLIVLNNSATMLWRWFQEREFTLQEVSSKLVEVYAIDDERADHDAAAICKAWQESGVLQ